MTDKIKIPSTKFHKTLDILCIIVLAGIFIIVGMSYGDLPDKIPTHYNFAGEIDGWGGKACIWMMPILGAVLFAGLSVIERFPSIWNTGVTITEKNRDRVYGELKNMLVTVKAGTVVLLCGIAFTEIFSADAAGMVLPATFLLVIGPTIFFIVRIYAKPKNEK